MKNIMFFCIPAYGHHNPTIAVVKELVNRGNKVRYYSFNEFIVNGGNYKPEYVLYLSKNGEEIATTTAVEKDTFPGEGWLRMVGVSPESRGTGAGKLIVLSALHSLAARGYKSTVLSTDDSRIPAISLYLSMGFEPIIFDDEHKERWEKVIEATKKSGK